MRTTLTLDEDVADGLERLRRARGQSLKDIINDALRRGLDDLTRRSQQRGPFRTECVDLGRLRYPASTASAKLSQRPRFLNQSPDVT